MEALKSHIQPRSPKQMHVGADRLTKGTEKNRRHGSISLLRPTLDIPGRSAGRCGGHWNFHHNPAPDRRQDGICHEYSATLLGPCATHYPVHNPVMLIVFLLGSYPMSITAPSASSLELISRTGRRQIDRHFIIESVNPLARRFYRY